VAVAVAALILVEVLAAQVEMAAVVLVVQTVPLAFEEILVQLAQLTLAAVVVAEVIIKVQQAVLEL
jgi:hypothetical protein